MLSRFARLSDLSIEAIGMAAKSAQTAIRANIGQSNTDLLTYPKVNLVSANVSYIDN